MFCGQCGNQIAEDAQFCPACGARVQSQVSQQSPPPAQDTVEPMTLPDTGQAAAQGYEVHTPPPAQMPRVKNYLVESILCTICCCLPFGIPGIVFAAQVDNKLRTGDVDGAKESSKKAKTWTLVSLITGLVFWLAMIGLSVSGILAFSDFVGDYQYWY